MAPVIPDLVPAHMGGLHPAEQALTIVLAFGPFVLLGAVIVARRRQDAAEEERERLEAERQEADRKGPDLPE